MGRYLLFVGLAVTGWSASAAPTGVVIELKDGSRLVGEVELEALGLSSPLGAVRVKAEKLASLAPLDDKEQVTIRTTTGDVVTGVPSPAKLEVKTSFGRVSIPFTLATRIDFTGKVGGGPPPPAAPPPNDTTVPQLGFRCADLTTVEERGQTTGGSVYVFAVTFRTGQPLLAVAATSDPAATTKLDRVRDLLLGCRGTQRVIVVKQPKYVSVTNTTLGARSGWVGFADNIQVN